MPLIFAVFPVLIIEALVFWAVASWLGLGWALFLMFALMAVGLLAAPFEMRRVGALAARQKVSAGRVAGDYGLLTAGAILAGSPGIASSIVGLLLILPPTRALVRGMLAKKLLRSIEDLGVRTFEAPAGRPPRHGSLSTPSPRVSRAASSREREVIDIRSNLAEIRGIRIAAALLAAASGFCLHLQRAARLVDRGCSAWPACTPAHAVAAGVRGTSCGRGAHRLHHALVLSVHAAVDRRVQATALRRALRLLRPLRVGRRPRAGWLSPGGATILASPSSTCSSNGPAVPSFGGFAWVRLAWGQVTGPWPTSVWAALPVTLATGGRAGLAACSRATAGYG